MRISGKWRSVTPPNPCPICGKASWCKISADGGAALCRRVENGSYKTTTDKGGVPYFLHRLDGTARPPIDPPPAPSADGKPVERADADTLNRVYLALLASLPLTQTHRENLLGRGLPDAEIDRRGYASLPGPGRAKIARELRERLGDTMLAVPGFFVRERNGSRYLTIGGPAGMIVPVRDLTGRIVALKIRRDESSRKPKYVFLSSKPHGGPGPGAPVHFPLGIAAPAEIVRVTEGELKADIATALTGVPTISIPGVGSWGAALPALRELGAKTVRLAFDADAATNPHVARALGQLADAIGREGWGIEFERWPEMYKGIDDSLAAGAEVELLAGDAAEGAIAAIAAAKPATPIDRLDAALADGPEVLFRDHELLAALAKQAESDPSEFACSRAKIQRSRVSLRSLDNALAPLRTAIRREQPPPTSAGAYRISGGRIVHLRPTPQGEVEVSLANFSARIVEAVTRDDGAERVTLFGVEGALADGTPLPLTAVSASEFFGMNWPTAAWGGRAVVFAGQSTRDHLRCGIELLSPDRVYRTQYSHTGWREVDGEWLYLHGGGAIGADGIATAVEVQLPEALGLYQLPPPPSGTELAMAVRASLGLLDGLAPDSVAVPLLAAVARAPLGTVDFGLHFVGPTGACKSELAALAQQFWGAGLDARHLPGSWSSTGNALESLLFALKDALAVIDDFAPTGATADVQRFHRDADRVFRGQGNGSGRARCRVDGTVRAAKPPRGLAFSTGEDIPRGQSLRARLLVTEISPGDVSLSRLTVCQRDASDGRYAEALAGYLRWLAPRIGDLRAGELDRRRAELRDRAIAEAPGGHARTPNIVADLAVGLGHYLDFAVEAGAIDAATRKALAARCWAALLAAGQGQAEHAEGAEPAAHFLRLLASAISSGRCHLAGPDGQAPDNATAWGWRTATIGTGGFQREEPQPFGRRVGWIKPDGDRAEVFLDPDAAYAEANELARQQGAALLITEPTLRRRLHERGLLVSIDDQRQKLLIRRTLDGARRPVLHIAACALFPPDETGPTGPIHEKPHENGPVSWAGSRAGNGKPAQQPAQNAGEFDELGRLGRSNMPPEAPPPENKTAGRFRGDFGL